MKETKKKLEVKKGRLKVLQATMRTVDDIVNNFTNNVQLFRLLAEKKNALDPEELALMDSIIQETATKLKKVGDLDPTPEKLASNCTWSMLFLSASI